MTDGFLARKQVLPYMEWRISEIPEFRIMTYHRRRIAFVSNSKGRGGASCSFSHFFLKGRTYFLFNDLETGIPRGLESSKGTWALVPIRIKFLGAQRMAVDLYPRPRSFLLSIHIVEKNGICIIRNSLDFRFPWKRGVKIYFYS